MAKGPRSLVMIVPWQRMIFVVDEGVAVSKKACRLLRLFSMAGFLTRFVKKPDVDRHSMDELKMNPAEAEANKRAINSHFSQPGVLFEMVSFFLESVSIRPLFSIIGNDYSLRR
jgi:hypothetical protein